MYTTPTYIAERISHEYTRERIRLRRRVLRDARIRSDRLPVSAATSDPAAVGPVTPARRVAGSLPPVRRRRDLAPWRSHWRALPDPLTPTLPLAMMGAWRRCGAGGWSDVRRSWRRCGPRWRGAARECPRWCSSRANLASGSPDSSPSSPASCGPATRSSRRAVVSISLAGPFLNGVVAGLIRNLRASIGADRMSDILGSRASVLGSLDPIFASGTPDYVDRPSVFEAVQYLVLELAHQQLVCIVLEDLHWADATSLDLVIYLASTIDSGQLGACGHHAPGRCGQARSFRVARRAPPAPAAR